MRLQADEVIGGVPARQLRDLLRYCGDDISAPMIADRLHLPRASGNGVLSKLVAEGVVEKKRMMAGTV